MPPKDLNPNRPQIWADGRQSPPFDVRAFARAALLFGREDMSALLKRCAASAMDAGAMVASGRWRVPEERLGRTGKYLPTYQRVAGVVAAGSRLLAHASKTLEKAKAEVPSQSLFNAVPKTATPVPADLSPATRKVENSIPPKLSADPDDPAIAAIRALIASTQPEPSAKPAPGKIDLAMPQVDAPKPDSRYKLMLERLSGIVLAYGLLGMSVPYGAVKAGLAHLNGEDLRKLEV